MNPQSINLANITAIKNRGLNFTVTSDYLNNSNKKSGTTLDTSQYIKFKKTFTFLR